MDLGIKDKVALITGGNRGIGRATAIELAREGCLLIITGRDADALEAVRTEIAQLGAEVVSIEADLATESEVESLISGATKAFGRVDILFNNAGHSHPSTTLTTTDGEWRLMLDVHLLATVRTCRALAPAMRDRGWGRIINTASIAGLSPMKGIPDYSAAKAAIISYTRSLAMELSSKGVTANALCPGLVHTEIWETFADQIGPSIGKTRQQIFDAAASQGSAIKRYARPEEIGKVVAFLASEAASYVSGSSIQVDGGSLAGFGIEF